jgi:hypothetical protein
LVTYIKSLRFPKGSKEAQYRDTIAIRMENWIPAIGHIFSCRSGIPWSAFDGKCVIFDISRMHEDAQIFLQIYFLRKLLFLKEITSELEFDVIYDFDELSKFLENNYVKTQGQGPLTVVDVARRARKRGVFLSYKDQVAHLIPPAISANCPTIVIFRLRQQDDLRKIQGEMNLTSDQAAYISQLENIPGKRECLYQNKDMKEAMLAEVEEADLSNLLTHDEIRELMKEKLKDLPWEPAGAGRTKSPEKRSEALSENASRMLQLIRLHPAAPLHKIRGMTGQSAHQFKKTIDHLAALSMITEPEALSLGLSGKPSFYTELLPTGNKALGLGPDEPHLVRGKNKSLLARVMLTILANYHERNGIEYRIEYHGCDLAAFDLDTKCFEVETLADTPQIARNIRRDINELDPAEIVVVFETVEQIARAREVAESRLSRDEMERVRFEQIKNFLID